MAPNTLLLNDGRGNYTKSNEFGTSYSSTRNLKLSDIDSDGDIDILITNHGRENEICLNDGSGNFTECHGFGSRDDPTPDVEVWNMDRDGHKDLILANREAQQDLLWQ